MRQRAPRLSLVTLGNSCEGFFSLCHRFPTAIVGLLIGGLMGVLALYFAMLVAGSDSD